MEAHSPRVWEPNPLVQRGVRNAYPVLKLILSRRTAIAATQSTTAVSAMSPKMALAAVGRLDSDLTVEPEEL